MTVPQLSESTEMYLKAMAEFGDDDVAIARLAARLRVTPVSANEMIRKLDEHGLVSHTPYKGVNLTKKGRQVACDVLRRQRLWEVFLYEYLKIEWAKIYELACFLEHATAPEVTEALADFLGHPKTCPRGNPIPDENGNFIPLQAIPLSEAQTATTLKILAINATATEILVYLQERNILPGQEVEVVDIAPLQGPLTIRINEKEIALGLQIAEFVLVERMPAHES
jgi:DtxR family Mn-dependent transcriptional regulator